MNLRTTLVAVLGMWLTVGLPVAWAEVMVQSDKDNVVGSRLAGTWEADAELTKRLAGNAAAAITFASDESIAAKVPAKFETFLSGKSVYLAGTMTFKESPAGPGAVLTANFLLIEHKGNPHLVYFLPKDGDPFGNAESMNVMLAVAKDTSNDLLFLGGDFNNQPFAAYKRVKPEAKP
jgi:hypothetical protein